MTFSVDTPFCLIDRLIRTYSIPLASWQFSQAHEISSQYVVRTLLNHSSRYLTSARYEILLDLIEPSIV